jgi:small conductance mechanosensitive channel
MDKEYLKKAYWEEILDQFLNWLITTGPSILIILILFALSLFLVRFVLRRMERIIAKKADKSDKDVEAEKRAKTLIDIMRGALKVTIWIVFTIILLKKFGIDIAPLLAGAGILGLAVGFGAQEMVRDVISGFFMLLENQIRTGDVAVINGTGGVVEKIELRTVTLRDLQGVVHIFQNGKINSLSNMTKEWSAAVFDIGVSYKSDVPQVISVMQEIGDELKADQDFGSKILEPMEIFGLNAFMDSSIVIKARLKTRPGEQWSVMREYNKRLKKAFDGKGIEIPFPQRTIHHIQEKE